MRLALTRMPEVCIFQTTFSHLINRATFKLGGSRRSQGFFVERTDLTNLAVGCVAVITDERSDMVGNNTVASSTGDSLAVSRTVKKCEERYWQSCNRFGNAAVVKEAPLLGESSGSTSSLAAYAKQLT